MGDRLLRPGWTSYDKRLQYDTYDVTSLLRAGPNAIGVTLGDGWYRGRLGFEGQRNTYGKHLGLLAQLVVRYADGRTEVIGTDEQWKASTGPILMSDIYDGETYDARLEKPGWSRAGYDDRSWRGVRLRDGTAPPLIAPVGPPVRRMQEVKPVRILEHADGSDRVRPRPEPGRVGAAEGERRRQARPSASGTPRCSTRTGNFYTENLRGAAQTLQYTLKGGGVEVFEPHFTFQGFRYVSVEGFPGTPTLDAVTGVVVHSDLMPTGTFETSNELVNRLQQNIVWGQRGNFVDVPTDCPQRDERLGWTGDAQVFARTAAFNMDVSGFFAKWLGDVAADQKPDGAVPWVIPDVLGRGHPGNDAQCRLVGRRRHRAVDRCTRRTATRACSRASTRACARGSSTCARRRATGCSGRRASTSATGSRSRRFAPTTRARRPTRTSSRRRTSRTRPDLLARQPRR